jgi:hypothetical protein
MWYEKCHIIIYNYLTFCTFSFEIKESSLSDTKCLIQYTVAPHCGDKRMAATLHEILSAELLCHDVISLKCGGKRQCKQRLFNVYSFILCIANSRSYCHFNYIVSILPASVRYTFLKKKWHLKSSNSDVSLVSERQKVTWRHAQNVVSLKIWYIFVYFNSTLVIWLKFAFIEMFDKLSTYILFWYNTVYQVLPVVWTNRITTRRYHTTGSTWYRVLYQHTMYVTSIYHV